MIKTTVVVRRLCPAFGLVVAVEALAIFACTGHESTEQATTAIRGVIRDMDGNVVDQATVQLYNSSSTDAMLTTQTNTTGGYIFSVIEPGDYEVLVTAPDATEVVPPNPRHVTVTPGETAPSDFLLALSTVSFAEHVQPVFASSCTGCHDGTEPSVGLSLAAGAAYANTVGVPSSELVAMRRIEPDKPDESYLVRKLQGTHMTVGGAGKRMPIGIPPVAEQEIRLIRRWIAEGALNN